MGGKRRSDEAGGPDPELSPDGWHADGNPPKRSRVGSIERAEDGNDQMVVGSLGHDSTVLNNRLEVALEESRGKNGGDEMGDGDGESDSDDQTHQTGPKDGYRDLYLDTINRAVLDFDFEKLCSVTLSNINVYSCLVCGKYFHGRGVRTPAMLHTVNKGHHVWIKMATKQVFVLPEGYEVTSESLDDIRYVVDPTYSVADVTALDRPGSDGCWDLDGGRYWPGFVGLNNIKANDYLNVVVHALAHIGPIRNFVMVHPDRGVADVLAHRFGVLVRKIWNRRAFKGHVSPHELAQAMAEQSGKRFSLTTQADPADLLRWLVNELHRGFGGRRNRPRSSIVMAAIQGQMRVETDKLVPASEPGQPARVDGSESTTIPFVVLPLDLPPAPLFQDAVEQTNIIPQVSLASVLAKFDGVRAEEGAHQRRRFRLIRPLPPFLLFHVKRFADNKFVAERNRTIVTFAPSGLDMSAYAEGPSDGQEELYDLVSNITHEGVKVRDDSVSGEAEKKVWSVQLLDKGRSEWVEVQDLFVRPAAAETLFIRETYIQVWERRRGGDMKP